jgi:ligand-binding sensor domain-containing protein/serine phosphatase RsbU (regulator of sigma subunit)
MNCRHLLSKGFVFGIFVLFLGVSSTLLALDPEKAITQYSVQILDIEGGLPANSVYAVRQTLDGYIWIGTSDGLVRFDSLNFELFNKRKISKLMDNDIRALYEDRNGTLWIGTDSGGLTRYKEGKFTTYLIKDQITLTGIRAIEEDRWGNLWIGSIKKGLTCLSNGEFINYTSENGLPDNSVIFIHKDGNDDLWITTYGGIAKLLKPGIFQIHGSQDRLFHKRIKTVCLYEADRGNLWIGTGGCGLFRFKKGKLAAYGAEEGIPNQTINYLYRDRENNLWIGTDGGGLTRMSKGVLSTLPGGKDGLASGRVYSIYEDREGSLWVGTIDGGLHQIKDGKFTTFTTREGLAHDNVYCIHEDRVGCLWIGTEAGLTRLKKGKVITKLTTGTGLLDNRVVCLFDDLNRCLWIGTWGGLHMFKDGKLSYLTKKDGLSDNRVKWILGDRWGNTWIGTENGLNRFENSSGKITVFTTKEGLSSNSIEFLFEDSRGNLWIGTDTGLNCIREGIINIDNLVSGLEDSRFRCAYEDKEGTLWLGTDSGLIRSMEKKTTLYTVQYGLVESNVYSILEDDKGYLWLAGQNGISRIKKKELEDFAAGRVDRLVPDSYDEKDGMKSRWCTGAGCKTQDGRFWFPTTVGVTTIDPNNIKTNNIAPVIFIKKLVVDGESVKMKENENQDKPLSLSPGKKRLEFYYTSVSFINPRKIKFKLQLKGYDRDWVHMGTTRSTTYTGLKPGYYTFIVTACNTDGFWNKNGKAFSFYLKPYFYQTVWFYIFIALFILIGAVSFYLFRIRQLKAREKQLGRLVELRTRDLKERTVELEKAHQNLRQSKEIIETKNRHIMDSMRYAQKIQKAMLPMKEKMSKELQEYLVIYKPKDIVSGDFYWFDAIDDHYFLAVADCTGHGVPGALLSMMGYMMLDEVVNERHVFDPAMILAHLHQGFRYALKQEMEENDTYDGMDIGLCRIDLPTEKVTFAGARHSLLYVRESKLIEIKGDRNSIGGRQKKVKHVFTNHEIGIENEIMIYLKTDGFADQHDPLNHKYGSRRLKEFFQTHAHLSADQQEDVLLKELQRHQANEEQRDDITILGIRLRV